MESTARLPAYTPIVTYAFFTLSTRPITSIAPALPILTVRNAALPVQAALALGTGIGAHSHAAIAATLLASAVPHATDPVVASFTGRTLPTQTPACVIAALPAFAVRGAQCRTLLCPRPGGLRLAGAVARVTAPESAPSARRVLVTRAGQDLVVHTPDQLIAKAAAHLRQ